MYCMCGYRVLCSPPHFELFRLGRLEKTGKRRASNKPVLLVFLPGESIQSTKPSLRRRRSGVRKKDVLISSFALLCGSVRPNRTYLREKKRILSVGIGKRVSCGAKKRESIFCPPQVEREVC